jgi:hypothetical protein
MWNLFLSSGNQLPNEENGASTVTAAALVRSWRRVSISNRFFLIQIFLKLTALHEIVIRKITIKSIFRFVLAGVVG